MPLPRNAERLVLALSLIPALLAAQVSDTTHAVPVPVTDSALRLPTDRASDLVAWAPGGGLDATGTPTWHGIPVTRGEWVIDGIHWATGLRSIGSSGVGPRPIHLEPALNALAAEDLSATPLGPVTIGLTTRGAGERWTAHGNTETGAPFRPEGGTGDSRLQAAAGGPIWGSFRLQVGGTLGARQAASGGVGYAGTPYYLATAIDTTMEYLNGSDSVTASVQRFTASTKVPYTPRSTADWTMRLDGNVGAAAMWAHWIGSRASEGLFNYADAFNPAQITGRNEEAYDLAVGVDAPLWGRQIRVALAAQHERSEQGPLTYASQLDTRDPGLGLMLGGVDLRWDMSDFPVDEQLITNYRENIAGSRRSPYDLDNTTQYMLLDQYRNSPYATYGWSEGGGPVGLLRFYDDRRLVASVGLVEDKALGGSAALGLEVVRHDARLYASQLTNQAFSNAWIEHPEEVAATLGWTHRADRWTLDAGVRVDRFNSNGRRPYVEVVDPGAPNYGEFIWFPRGASMAATADSLVRWVPDASHTAAAPHVLLTGTLAPGWEARAGYQRSAIIPDFADLYDGINTDLAVTSPNAPFGRDLGHQIVDHLEAGLDHDNGTFHAQATYFQDDYRKVDSTRLGVFYDPLKKWTNELFYHNQIKGPTIKGVTLSATADLSTHLNFYGAYTYQTTGAITYFGPLTTTKQTPLRHHTLTMSTRLTGPERGIAAGFGAIVTLRVLSGLAQGIDYSSVPLSSDGPYRSQDIPAWKSVDLRLVKSTEIGGHRATAYIDARNLLNTANLVHVFVFGDPRSSADDQELAWRADSASWAVEANKNGVYAGGTIDLTFGGAGRGGCGSWLESDGVSNPPNCGYLIAAEQRFGNGDGQFTAAEQRAASTASFLTQFGNGALSGPPRAVRVGIELAF